MSDYAPYEDADDCIAQQDRELTRLRAREAVLVKTLRKCSAWINSTFDGCERDGCLKSMAPGYSRIVTDIEKALATISEE